MSGGGILDGDLAVKEPGIPIFDDITRRVFVKDLGFVSLGLFLGTLGGCEDLAEQIRNRPIRRWLRTGSPEVDADIATYKHAVELMKALDQTNPTDPRSWLNQATIHGVPAHFNFCEHGTNHFFDWHRAYLFYFEKICQKLTGNAKFGLPYWNWNQTPDINQAFLVLNSVLYLPRNNTSLGSLSSVSTGALDPIFQDTNFFTFSSQIEGTPHNNVHSFTGGTMGGYASAQDPIFWNHHCMVDYCWAKWNIDLGNNNSNDTTWFNHVNSHFVDADGNPASEKAGITILYPLLAYQYESSAIGSNAARSSLRTKAEYQKVERRLKQGANVRFDIKSRMRIAERAVVTVARPVSLDTKVSAGDFTGVLNVDAARDRVFASIDFARLPATSDFAVRVYIDLPTANAGTPITDPHYAGSFAFFGTEPPNGPSPSTDQHGGQKMFLVNITPTLQRLRRNQELREGNPLSVQLVAVPFAGKFEKPDTQLLLEKIDIVVTPVIINPPSE
jgi:tyrosinase